MAAFEPVAQGVLAQFGSVERGAARGLALRMDHGTQYLSEHFQNQIKAWGVASSFAFLQEPETNGAAERFIRTLKEQAIYGGVFQNLEEARGAVAELAERYNHQWRVEKNAFRRGFGAVKNLAFRILEVLRNATLTEDEFHNITQKRTQIRFVPPWRPPRSRLCPNRPLQPKATQDPALTRNHPPNLGPDSTTRYGR